MLEILDKDGKRVDTNKDTEETYRTINAREDMYHEFNNIGNVMNMSENVDEFIRHIKLYEKSLVESLRRWSFELEALGIDRDKIKNTIDKIISKYQLDLVDKKFSLLEFSDMITTINSEKYLSMSIDSLLEKIKETRQNMIEDINTNMEYLGHSLFDKDTNEYKSDINMPKYIQNRIDTICSIKQKLAKKFIYTINKLVNLYK